MRLLTANDADAVIDFAQGRRLFESLNFKPEVLLTDWVIDAAETTHDLLIMS